MLEQTKLYEEWTWVNGYKGTDKDMTCRDFQYKMNKPFEMLPDEEIVECRNGFHLCKELVDVFDYYPLASGHRFFEVKALVRTNDLERYAGKLVAKAIIFTRELDVNEILEAALTTMSSWEREKLRLDRWSDDHKKLALEVGFKKAFEEFRIDDLESYGYSRPFAVHVIQIGGYDVACAVGSQKDLSMDMKAMYIYQGAMAALGENRSRKRVSYRTYSF